MSISKAILGMNARNFLYISRYNKVRAKVLADNKLATKRLLLENNISTVEIIHSFATRKGIQNYSWNLPKEGFAIKPARGYGGEGILVFDKWEGEHGTTISGETYTLKQIKSHILDIFDGIYSLQSIPDKAYIEERIVPDPFFKKLAEIGLPDIRIIVFNKVPVMAMLRIPTLESHGRANLHQGAVGIGIGMRTGITKHAILYDKALKFIPGTKIKASGIKIPNWDDILLLASRAQTVSGLGFAGVDIVVDKQKGPIVLEINARPGLSIQNANLASLRTRLETVEGLKVLTCERGVEVARSIFAEDLSYKVKTEPKILSVIEPVTIFSSGTSREYLAKLDTGAYRTSIDKSIARELGLPFHKETFITKSATGEQERRAVKLTMSLGGRKISTIATVASRSHLNYPIIIGVRDLKGFYINPANFPPSPTDL
jgi:alpha-L-glutamate ligase-like protein